MPALASGIVFLGDATKPRVQGPRSDGVEYWQITGDGAATTVAITSAKGDTIIAGSLYNGSYVLSGTNNTTITFTVTTLPATVFLATLITKPVGT